MMKNIIKKLGSGIITYFIIFSIINFLASYAYMAFATNVYNNNIVGLINNTINDQIISSGIFGMLMSLYLFIYIGFFIFFFNKMKLSNKSTFIIFNLNLYLLLFIGVFIVYIIMNLSVSILSIFFSILPLLTLFTLITNGEFNDEELKPNVNHGMSIHDLQEDIITKTENKNTFGLGNNINIHKEDNILGHSKPKSNFFTFLKGLFTDKNESNINIQENKELNPFIDIDSLGKNNNEIEKIDIDSLGIDNIDEDNDDIEYNGEDKKELNLDDLLSTDIDNIEGLLGNKEDEDSFILEEDDEDYKDYDISIKEEHVGNENENENENGNNNKEGHISPASLYVKGFQINRAQDMEKLEELVLKL